MDLSSRFTGSESDLEKRCLVCGERSRLTSNVLQVCASCIRQRRDEALPYLLEAHKSVRKSFSLPPKPPKSPGGISCRICSNGCVMGDGEKGFCGLRENMGGRLVSKVNHTKGLLFSYIDPHVTNCCSAWFCPAGTGSGYPRYAYKSGPEVGWFNLAVFFYGCNFDCLFCQNSSHRNLTRGRYVTLESLSKRVLKSKKISCVCYFGGSPEPQLPFAIEASEKILEERENRIIRICFEWNGCGNKSLVRKAAELAFNSGGNIKFDLKCFTPSMSIALSGVPNEKSFENFRFIAEEFYGERKNLPVLTATSLLVPNYVNFVEIGSIAKFIAELDPDIPYSLLVFHPDFAMSDLPITPYRQVVECYRAARRHLNRVHVGNIELLGSRRSILLPFY